MSATTNHRRAPQARVARAARAADHPAVEIVLPVYNEERILEASVRTLHEHLTTRCRWSFVITIADNASTDATRAAARRLARELDRVRIRHLDRKGRGRALRDAWGASEADVVAYMDIDLSTGLCFLAPLVAPLLEGHADIAVGSRLVPGAQVTRSVRRELLSRGYNGLLALSLGLGVADAQCGFKAGRREVIEQLLPLVADEEWFFDTELLHAARRAGFSVRELPVQWREDPDSRVRILETVRQDLRGIARLWRAGRPHARSVRQPGVASARVSAGRR